MKKVVPFGKTISFKTMISEITDIEVKHTLSLKDNNEVEGDILVDGKYKTTDASIIEEEFHYKLPFVIAIDPKYIVDNVVISIDDFNYEIINEDSLKVDVDISLDNIEEKELVREDNAFKTDDLIQKLEIKEEKEEEDIKEIEEQDNKNLGSIFSNLTAGEETFSTYNVYIVRETDTIEGILDKYNISREELADYNDLDDVSIGSKLIIPCSND